MNRSSGNGLYMTSSFLSTRVAVLLTGCCHPLVRFSDQHKLWPLVSVFLLPSHYTSSWSQIIWLLKKEPTSTTNNRLDLEGKTYREDIWEQIADKAQKNLVNGGGCCDALQPWYEEQTIQTPGKRCKKDQEDIYEDNPSGDGAFILLLSTNWMHKVCFFTPVTLSNVTPP